MYWEILLIQSHSTAILLPLSIFWKIVLFCRKNHPFFRKDTKFLNVLRILTFSVALYCNFPTFSDFKKEARIFSKKPIYVFSKKLKCRTFWDIFLIQLQSASKWLLSAVSKKTQDFFWTTNFFSRRNHFLNVLRSLTNSVASYNKVLSLAISTKSIFSEKT